MLVLNGRHYSDIRKIEDIPGCPDIMLVYPMWYCTREGIFHSSLVSAHVEPGSLWSVVCPD